MGRATGSSFSPGKDFENVGFAHRKTSNTPCLRKFQYRPYRLNDYSFYCSSRAGRGQLQSHGTPRTPRRPSPLQSRGKGRDLTAPSNRLRRGRRPGQAVQADSSTQEVDPPALAARSIAGAACANSTVECTRAPRTPSRGVERAPFRRRAPPSAPLRSSVSTCRARPSRTESPPPRHRTRSAGARSAGSIRSQHRVKSP